LDEVEGPEIVCPKCKQGRVVRKRARKVRRAFFGCNRYPDCDYAMWEPPLPIPCPNCSGPLVAEGEEQAKCVSCERVFERAALPQPEAATAPAEKA
jgi:DNA topoisomerase-1